MSFYSARRNRSTSAVVYEQKWANVCVGEWLEISTRAEWSRCVYDRRPFLYVSSYKIYNAGQNYCESHGHVCLSSHRLRMSYFVTII